ncbi:MAG: V-type ATP synthase subunit E [Candidatus Freyarchaeota archaeon]
MAIEENVEEEITEIEEEPENERLKKIKEKIEKDAEQRASAIIEEAKKRAKETEKEALSKAERKAEEILRRAKEEAERYKRRRLAEAKLKAKQKKTRAQEEIIEKAFSKANEKLKELTSSPEYKGVLEKLIQRAAIGLGGGDLEVVLVPGHDKYLPDLSSIAKKVEEETKNPTKISLSKEKLDADGGCIVRRKNGTIYIDNSFQAILERKIKELRVEVAKALTK